MGAAGRASQGADAAGCVGAPAPGFEGAGGWDEQVAGRRGPATSRVVFRQGGRAEGDARSCGRPGRAATVDMDYPHDTPGGAAPAVAELARGDPPDGAAPPHHVHLCLASAPDGARSGPSGQSSSLPEPRKPRGSSGNWHVGCVGLCGPLPDGASMASVVHGAPDGARPERDSGFPAATCTVAALRGPPDGAGLRHGLAFGSDGAPSAPAACTAARGASTPDGAEQPAAVSDTRRSWSAWHVQSDEAAGLGGAPCTGGARAASEACGGSGGGKRRAPSLRCARRPPTFVATLPPLPLPRLACTLVLHT